MADTAIHPIPKQGKFRRALAAVGAWLQALDYTGFDYTLDRCVYRKFDSASTQGMNEVSSRPDDRPAQASSWHPSFAL
jgi:hypothetical protein